MLAREAVANALKEERKTILERDINMAYLKVKEMEEEHVK
jgi:histone H3/H4